MPALLATAAAAAVAAAVPDTGGMCIDAAHWLNGTNYHGDGQGLAHHPGASAADCCAQCSKITDCKFFSWSGLKGDQMCWFFKDNRGPRHCGGDCMSGWIGTWTPAPTPKPTPVPVTPPPPPYVPPGPDPAPPTKPVQVFVMMGQSNMLGMGTITGWKDGTLEYAVAEKKKYPYLVDKSGDWVARTDARNVFVMGVGNASFDQAKMEHNEWLGANATIKKTIGPELGIGNYVANYTGSPVMFLKSCIGNRALGWDLLPPGTARHDYTDSQGKVWTYAGYHDSPERVPKGSPFNGQGWMAGEQYDGDTLRAKHVLGDIGTYYPGAKNYEVAGFFWWQGDKDSRDDGLASRYEVNLVALIKQLRKEYNAPNAKFVTASLGQSEKGATDGGGKILDAMLAVDGDSGKYPEFKGNVATVYTHPLEAAPGSSGSHYGRNAETYMNVGEAMGNAMVGLLKGKE